MTKDLKDKKCSLNNILKTIESLDMQINRIKNQLSELRMFIYEEKQRGDIVEMENVND